MQMRLSDGRVWRPLLETNYQSGTAVLVSWPNAFFFAAFDILLELRVHLITQADYGYRSRMRSRQQQT